MLRFFMNKLEIMINNTSICFKHYHRTKSKRLVGIKVFFLINNISHFFLLYAEDLRQMEEREYVKRIKEDIQQRQMAYAYRSINCHGGFIFYGI